MAQGRASSLLHVFTTLALLAVADASVHDSTSTEGASTRILRNPRFAAPIANVTVPIGREATLVCVVEDLGPYKVAWLQVNTQTILTIHTHIITKSPRIGLTHSERNSWFLHIKDIREKDRGFYMCQINTDPMKSQIGYLDVVVPPDILDYSTSADMVVQEGADVNFRCVAKGSPEPHFTWRRELGATIKLPGGKQVTTVDGPTLNLTRVTRKDMGPYLCIASNGVPPSVSKRIMLIVQFPPTIFIENQLVGAYEGQSVSFECHSEAYPKSINYWTTDKGEIVPQNGKFEPFLTTHTYRTRMLLKIKSVSASDYGKYKCVAKNSIGDAEGFVQLFAIPKPSKLLKGGIKGDQANSLFQGDGYYSGCEELGKSKFIVLVFLVKLPFIL